MKYSSDWEIWDQTERKWNQKQLENFRTDHSSWSPFNQISTIRGNKRKKHRKIKVKRLRSNGECDIWRECHHVALSNSLVLGDHWSKANHVPKRLIRHMHLMLVSRCRLNSHRPKGISTCQSVCCEAWQWQGLDIFGANSSPFEHLLKNTALWKMCV
jgi:hypothetical protein